MLRVTALGRVRSTGLGCNFKWFRSYGLCQCLFLLFFFQQNLLQLTGILVEKRITWFSASESKVLCVCVWGGDVQHNEAKPILTVNTLLKFSVLWTDGLDFAIHTMCVPDLNIPAR